MADGGRGVTCPLCKGQFFGAAPYASHLADAHGLVDDDGTETILPEPEVATEPDPRVVATEPAPSPEPGATREQPRRSPKLPWRHSLALAIKTLAALVVLASAVAVAASLADAGL